jgi:hypothetical protein
VHVNRNYLAFYCHKNATYEADACGRVTQCKIAINLILTGLEQRNSPENSQLISFEKYLKISSLINTKNFHAANQEKRSR